MSKRKKKPKMEFRYYQMPAGSPILALLGDKWVQNYGRDVDYLHFHNHLEIGYCYKGNGYLVMGEEDVRYSERMFTVIPKNYPHTTNSDPGDMSKWEYLFIDLEGFLTTLYPDNPIKAERMARRINSRAMILYEEEYPEMSRYVLKIMDIMRYSNEYYLEEAKGILAALLVSIARLNPVGEEAETEEESGKLTNIIFNTVDYISTHYMEPIKVEDLARISHISETHFRRIFSSYMKMSPLEYINTVWIRTACERLKKTDEPVADIAHKCGFTTSSTFNRNFRQLMGVTPVEWRKRPENYERQLLKFDIHYEEGW